MPKPRFELTESEWTLMKAIWTREPCSAPEIQQELVQKTKWTYSTVRTLMDRMVAKGLLKAEKKGHLTVYRSVVTRSQAQKSELLYALQHAFNGALTPMLQCLLDSRDLTAAGLDEIEQLIKARKKETK
jgi:BlaI family penicillinase repressor